MYDGCCNMLAFAQLCWAHLYCGQNMHIRGSSLGLHGADFQLASTMQKSYRKELMFLLYPPALMHESTSSRPWERWHTNTPGLAKGFTLFFAQAIRLTLRQGLLS